jgi:hypothetical protein
MTELEIGESQTPSVRALVEEFQLWDGPALGIGTC